MWEIQRPLLSTPLPHIFRAPVPRCDYFGAEYENSTILEGTAYKEPLIMCLDL